MHWEYFPKYWPPNDLQKLYIFFSLNQYMEVIYDPSLCFLIVSYEFSVLTVTEAIDVHVILNKTWAKYNTELYYLKDTALLKTDFV